MDIHTDRLGPGQVVLKPVGRLDALSSPELRLALHTLAVQATPRFSVVVDLKEVDFMDSSGLSALVSGMKALRKNGGSLGICNAAQQIHTALHLTMLDKVFPPQESVAAALRYLETNPPD